MFCYLYMYRNNLEVSFLNFCTNKFILTLLVHWNVWKYSDLIIPKKTRQGWAGLDALADHNTLCMTRHPGRTRHFGQHKTHWPNKIRWARQYKLAELDTLSGTRHTGRTRHFGRDRTHWPNKMGLAEQNMLE